MKWRKKQTNKKEMCIVLFTYLFILSLYLKTCCKVINRTNVLVCKNVNKRQICEKDL